MKKPTLKSMSIELRKSCRGTMSNSGVILMVCLCLFIIAVGLL